MWIITKFSGSTPVRRPVCSKPRRKFLQTSGSYALKSQFIGLIFVADIWSPCLSSRAWPAPKATTYVRQARRPYKAHFKLNRPFKVIPGHPCVGASRNPERRVVVIVQLMPTLSLKLMKIWQQECGKFVDFRDSTPIWWRIDALARNAFEYLQMIYIARS